MTQTFKQRALASTSIATMLRMIEHQLRALAQEQRRHKEAQFDAMLQRPVKSVLN